MLNVSDFFSLADIVGCVINQGVKNYCLQAPFDPPEIFPEFPTLNKINKDNSIYPLVRQLLFNLGLDKDNFGTKNWNPFHELIKPGQIILIKPNLVTHEHIRGKEALYSSISHGSILRPLIDYIYLALRGEGSIIVADNPVASADFDKIMQFTGIVAMVDELKSRKMANIEIIDLRPKILTETPDGRFKYESRPGDPLGYVTIDLGSDSAFGELDAKPHLHYYTLADHSVNHIDPKFQGKSKTDDFHNPSSHRYIVSRSVLNADVIINVAKMKSHCKAGVSLSLKNMIGIVFEKDCMPHHRPGLPPDGDSFPYYPASHFVAARKGYLNLKKWIRFHRFPGVKAFRNWLQNNKVLVGRQIEHGNWKGNDTIWRTILDLNRIVFYADKNGEMQEKPQRKFFALVDGVISQQGEGPMGGHPVATSIIVGGFNPVLVDALAIKTMGLDFNTFKSISNANQFSKWKLMADREFDLSFLNRTVPNLNFELSKGWR